MSLDTLVALTIFALVTTITPGPNNVMLMASGANFGFRRTVPHMLGIGFGLASMMVLTGVGLIRLFDAWPPSHLVLKVVSVGYLLYLSWRIATAAAPREGESRGAPFTFLQAAAFQWVNPKAWSMALTANAVYAPSHSLATVLSIAVVFFLVGMPAISCWTLLGQGMRRWLVTGVRLRVFNVTMALLLVASLYPVLMT